MNLKIGYKSLKAHNRKTKQTRRRKTSMGEDNWRYKSLQENDVGLMSPFYFFFLIKDLSTVPVSIIMQ